ncbi:hypothetical protein BBF96_01185 [Anoxybacter fermentans]|uniref:adenosylhomocysteine nucleosidase n=1 Tax=Anoxybacter fermentans TaxID=1323375 RepID=A0A3Q9HNK5_9FIRM|nr:5'-methylthioadenosine/adenosylhomocysteine nucleosidase [Anoxybacter fermentans]AZR72126.1 hypothetical protein BBF96_01185 [Anoxybacter fermentans]
MVKIGIICAFKEEAQHILQEMEIEEEVERLKTRFYKGKFMGREVVFVISGIGKVSSALCTHILIDQFGVELVIFAGIAGGLNPDLIIGDTVIATETFYHDIDWEGQGIEKNTVYSVFRTIFKTDSILIKKLKKGLSDKKLSLPSILKSLRQGKELTITFGRILTGDQVIASKKKVQQLFDKLAGDCVDMESAAVAQTCFLNDIPFLIIRTISDLADEGAMQIIKEILKPVLEVNYQILKEVLFLIDL